MNEVGCPFHVRRWIALLLFRRELPLFIVVHDPLDFRTYAPPFERVSDRTNAPEGHEGHRVPRRWDARDVTTPHDEGLRIVEQTRGRRICCERRNSRPAEKPPDWLVGTSANRV